MYFQGDNIIINIISDKVTDLTSKDFVVMIYPHFDKENDKYIVKLQKEEATIETKDDITKYTFIIPYTITKDLIDGDYDLELLVKNNNNIYRTTFQKQFAFFIKFANTKLI